jgi:two-component system LytT family response regulator
MTENIIRIEANSNYCSVYFINGYPLTVAKLLHWFEEKLMNDNFCRMHRSHIVNKMFIYSISCYRKLTISIGEKLQISRRKKILYIESVHNFFCL